MSVVVGFLANEEGRAALQAGVAEARLREHRLLVMVHTGSRTDAEGMDAAEDEVRDRLEGVDLPHEVRRISRGEDVADELIRVAEESDAELIVIGLRRRSATGKLILGSNAQRILLDAATPVLAVKPARS